METTDALQTTEHENPVSESNEQSFTVSVMDHGGYTINVDGWIESDDRIRIQEKLDELGIMLSEYRPGTTLGEAVIKESGRIEFVPRDGVVA